jgi:hypothetical protein
VRIATGNAGRSAIGRRQQQTDDIQDEILVPVYPIKMSSSNDAVESSTAAEMEDTIARISSHKGIEGVLIMDRRGKVVFYS